VSPLARVPRRGSCRRPVAPSATLPLLAISCFLCSCAREDPHQARDRVHFPRAESLRHAGAIDAAIETYRESIRSAPRDPRPYFSLVECRARAADLDAVESELRGLLASDPRNPSVRYGLGCVAMKRKSPEDALAQAQGALALDRGFGHGYLLMGSAHYFAGRPREALRAWDRARRVFHAQADAEYEAWAINRIALVRRELAEYGPALEGFRRALALQGARGDRQAQQLILGNIGLTHTDLGDLSEAMASFHTALSLARSIGDAGSECWNLTNLSHLHLLAGDHRRGIEYADTAISMARSIGSPVDEVEGLLHRAGGSLALGDPLPALADARRALALSDSLADERNRAGAILTIARADLSLGRLDAAREAYARSDSIFCGMGAEQGSWEASMGLCEVALRLGDSSRAIAEAERTLARCAQMGYADGEEALRLFLADLALRSGDPSRALDQASLALRSSRKDGRRGREALALCRSGRVRLALADSSAAVEEIRASCALAREVRDPEIVWECEWAAAAASRSIDPEAAVEHYRAALDAVESVRRRLRIEELKADFIERRIDLHREAADLLVRLGRDIEALEICEKERASAFRDEMLEGAPRVDPPIESPRAASLRALEGRLRALETSLAGIAGGRRPDRSRVRALEREISRTKAEWARARQDLLLADSSTGSALGAGADPDARAIAAALAPDEALVEYALGLGGSLCFVLRRDGVRAVRLEATSRAIEELVREIRGPLTAPRSLSTLSFDARLARRLREWIIDPIEPFIGDARRLYIVPDRALHHLPFEMLVVSQAESAATDTLYGGFRRTVFLCDRFAIRYLPSAAFLPAPARGPTGEGRAGVGLLAVGASDPLASRGQTDGAREGAEILRASVGSTDRLPFAAEEARRVSRLLPQSRCLTGAEATETSLKTLAPAYRFLHISAHGTVDEEVPLYSGLALAPDPEGADDGFLHAHEILPIPLDCELVTLSACESGLGRLYAGEGVLGLGRSFLRAGAAQTLVSLWSVNDASTALLMESFYAGLSRGLDAGEALRDAKRDLRTRARSEGGGTVSLAHPYFWAPFVLIGPAPARSF